MKSLRSAENLRLYNVARQHVKTVIKQAKRRYEENIAAESKNNAKLFFSYINNKKHIRSGIGPLKDSAGTLVTDDQSMTSMLNNYFSSVCTATAENDHVATNDSDTMMRQPVYGPGCGNPTEDITLHANS